MLRKYAMVLIVLSLLMMVLTTSGCYTVLKMRSGTVDHSYYVDDDDYDTYGDWYNPFYFYQPYPYHYYSYAHTYYHPWTYGCFEPYWSYSHYYRTYASGYVSNDYDPVTWQKGPRRRGFQTRTVSPSNMGERRASPPGQTYSDGRRALKTLRKVGTGMESKPVRRTGIDRTPSSTSRTTSRSTPAVTRQTTRSSSPSPSKETTRTGSSSPARRRGSRR